MSVIPESKREPGLSEDLELAERLLASTTTQNEFLASLIDRILRRSIDHVTDQIEIWRHFCAMVAEKGPSGIQDWRDPFQRWAKLDIERLQRTIDIATRMSRTKGRDWPQEKEARAALALALKFAAAIERWKTDEDLEELAVEWFPLGEDELTRLREKYPAPLEWYRGPAPQPEGT